MLDHEQLVASKTIRALFHSLPFHIAIAIISRTPLKSPAHQLDVCWYEKVVQCNVSVHDQGCMALPSCHQMKLDGKFIPLSGHVLHYEDRGLMLSFS